MKKILTILAVLVVLTSCYKINPWLDRKFYDGVWEIEKKVITQFDETGNYSAQDEFEIDGELTLRKDSLFYSIGIEELTIAGRWTVNRVGKGDIIYIWDDPQSTGPICDRKVTVTKKSSKKMILQFIQIDTEGKIEFKTEYFLNFKEKINYKEKAKPKGFRYTNKNGDLVAIPLTAITVEDASYPSTTGGSPIPCKEVTVEFAHYDANNVYQAIKLIFYTDIDDDYTGTYPFTTTGGNRVVMMMFWDGGTTPSYVNVGNYDSSALKFTKFDHTSTTKIISGTWSEVQFNSIPQSLNEAKMTNVEIDAIL